MGFGGEGVRKRALSKGNSKSIDSERRGSNLHLGDQVKLIVAEGLRTRWTTVRKGTTQRTNGQS